MVHYCSVRLFGLVAGAEVIRTTDDPEYPGADTYVGNDTQVGPGSNRGAENRMRLRQNNASRSKTSYIRFNISEVTGDLSGSFLTFETTYVKSAGKAVTVYGLLDESLDFWGESTITYNNAPAMLSAADGFADLDETKLISLGTFTTPTTAAPTRFSTDPAAVNMADFLASDTNGAVTIILLGADDETELATKEHATYIPPTLTMPNASLGGAIDPVPADGVSVNRNILTQLSWTLIPGIARCDVYFGTDPNTANPLTDKLSFDPAPTSLDIDDFPGYAPPLPEETYYWRVDCYDGAAEPNFFEGNWWSFTATSAPVSTGIAPAAQAKFAGENAEAITAGFASSTALTRAWYRSNDNDNSTDADDTPVGGNSDTLSLSNVTTADEGWYYCKATNAGGEARSGLSRLTIKRLLAHYAMEGNADNSAGGLHGTLVGEPAFVAGVNELTGQAMRFDGTDDLIDLPDGFSDFAAGVSFSVWANPAAVTDWARFIDLGNGATSDNVFMGRNASTINLSFSFYRGGTSAGMVTATGALVLNEWQMLVATMDETGAVVLYRNGLPVATGTLSQMPNIITRTSNFVGDSNWAANALYNGLMDDVRVYNYAISADNVADMYSGIVGNFCRYPLDLDYSGDCKVGLADLAIFAADWLTCGLYPECP